MAKTKWTVKTVNKEETTIDRIHINSYPKLETHYVWNRTKREFIVGYQLLNKINGSG